MKTALIALRSLVFNVCFFLWTLIPPILFVWTLLLPRGGVMRVVEFWQSVATGMAKYIAGIDYRIVGIENLPEGACIVAAKHQSAWETCLLHLIFKEPAIVLKKELTRVPIWGWFARATRLIPVDRKGGAAALLTMKKACDDAVREGRKIVIFPQGTRVLPGVKKPYKVGVVALYQDLGLPIVPVALNSGLFWPKGSFMKKPGTITIEFLPPIPAGLSRSQMMRRLETEIETASDRLASNS